MKSVKLAGVVCIVGLLAPPIALWAQSAPPDTVPTPSALPPTIPLFPLPDVVLFPNVSVPLRIFEPRYRAMVADALKDDRIIGMVTLRPGWEDDYEGRPPVFPVGCAGVITDVELLPNGEYNLVLRGLERFRVTAENEGGAYRVGQVTPMPEIPPDVEARAAIQAQRRRLDALLAESGDRLGVDPVPPAISDEDLVSGLARLLALDAIERQELLEQESVLLRLRTLIDRLERELEPPPGSRMARIPRPGLSLRVRDARAR